MNEHSSCRSNRECSARCANNLRYVASTPQWMRGPPPPPIDLHLASIAKAAQVAAALGSEHLPLRAVIVNRTIPDGLAAELGTVEPPAGAEPLVEYARAYASAQADVLAAASAWAPAVLTLPSQPALVDARRSALVDLGALLLRGLGND